MSSLIVEVCRIEKVFDHPNADALELAHIKGWQCVIPKGKYRAGDLVTYIPIDSVLPLELSERLGITKYLSGGRVRCAKLRNEPSFGVAIDVADSTWTEGHDVMAYYGITKYDPPVTSTEPDTGPNHPLFFPYTDIENMRNFPALIREGEEVSVTEKIHGTNCRVAMLDGQLFVGSMDTPRLAPEVPAQGRYWYPTTLPGVRALLDEQARASRQVIIFGETYGNGIQKSHRYGTKGTFGFAVFDVLVDGRFLDLRPLHALCGRHGVPIVPELYRGPFSLETVRALSVGKTTVGGDTHVREGVVVRPTTERRDPNVGRVILKYVGDDFLFGKNISDSKDV